MVVLRATPKTTESLFWCENNLAREEYLYCVNSATNNSVHTSKQKI